MNLLFSLYIVALFVALTPGVLLKLPKGGSKVTVAVVHGLVLATVLYFTYEMVQSVTYEGFDAASDRKAAQAERQQAIRKINEDYARQEAAAKKARQEAAARKAQQAQEEAAAKRAQQAAARKAQQEAAAAKRAQEAAKRDQAAAARRAAARNAQKEAAEATAMRASQRAAEAAARAEKAKANANRYF